VRAASRRHGSRRYLEETAPAWFPQDWGPGGRKPGRHRCPPRSRQPPPTPPWKGGEPDIRIPPRLTDCPFTGFSAEGLPDGSFTARSGVAESLPRFHSPGNWRHVSRARRPRHLVSQFSRLNSQFSVLRALRVESAILHSAFWLLHFPPTRYHAFVRRTAGPTVYVPEPCTLPSGPES